MIMENIKNLVSETLGKEVTETKINKGNGVVLTGLIVKEENNISPTIYINDLEDQGLTDLEIASVVISRYKNAPKLDDDINDAISKFSSWEKIKGKIRLALINKELNEDILEELPHRSYGGDLAIIYYVDVIREGTVKIRNEYLDKWGVSEEDLYKAAFENTSKDVVVNNIAEIVPVGSAPMWIVTNSTGHYGAAAIMFAAAQLAEVIDGDIIVIPSSIHEVICFPREVADDLEEVAQLICEVNAQNLLPTEILSNHPYEYVDGNLQ